MTNKFLPRPQGWKILIRKPKVKEKTDGGIIIPDQVKDVEDYLSVTGEVAAIGPLCWTNRETGKPWDGGPWCKVGDWVIIPKFTAFKMEIDDDEYRIINNDEIIAVVIDPTRIKVYS